MKRHFFRVSASHVSKTYSFVRERVRVNEDADGFAATHPMLGYGKTFSTPEAAIRHLLEDHACTDIRVERED